MEEITENYSFNYQTTDIYTQTLDCCKAGEAAKITTEGLLEILVFHLDLYAVKPDARLLKKIQVLMEYYGKQVQKSDGDFSFATGKSGFLYVATRYYEIEKSSDFLEAAMALMEEGINSFINSSYTSNAIFTGRSGCLLVLNYYNSIHQDEKVQKWIEALLAQIIAQAQLSDKGVYWTDHFEKLKGLLDFKTGNAGIAYLFLLLGALDKSNGFQALAKQIYSHQRQYWDDHLGWKKSKKGIQHLKAYKEAIQAVKDGNHAFFEAQTKDLSILLGSTKLALHLWEKLKEDSFKTDAIRGLEACKELFLHSPLSIEEALWIGNLFLEAARILADQQYRSDAKAIAKSLKEKSISNTSDSFATCVLEAKMAHFYLALEHPSLDHFLLSQCTAPLKSKQEQFAPIQLKESLLQTTFSRTLSLVKSLAEEFLNDYLKQPIKEKEVFNFMLFLKKKLHQFSPRQKKQVSEILKLEITRYNIKKGIRNYAHLEAKNIYNYQRVQALFNAPDEALLATVLQMNPSAKKITTDWNWELKQGAVPPKKLLEPESKTNVFLLPHYTSLVTEYWQNPHNVVLSYFENQKPIAEAIAQAKQFYLAQDNIYMDKFSQFIMAEQAYVLANMDKLILNIIKEYMGTGLLEIVS